jgi:hypothetical protein
MKKKVNVKDVAYETKLLNIQIFMENILYIKINLYLFVSLNKINRSHKICLNNLYEPIICQYINDYSSSAGRERTKQRERTRK